MKTTIEKIVTMQAYLDGKKIEVKYADTNWENCPSPLWDWDSCDYRIKPEPKYRPYKSADECFADMIKHGEWIKDKRTGVLYQIIEVGAAHISINIGCFTLCDLLKDFTHLDGTPCGILKEK